MISKIAENLNRINSNIELLKRTLNLSHSITLLAVSKVQPIELILEAYNCGHRDFAENYVDELLEKSSQLPPDINWHMIGHVQSNKCKKLLSIPNLLSVHTVDSISLATRMNSVLKNLDKTLLVFIQVNTSGESSKSGVIPEDAFSLVEHIKNNCPFLNISGFMTIGELGNTEDFKLLSHIRKKIAEQMGIEEFDYKLSMGMSSDYEQAISYGSNYVRVGTSIFGERRKT